MCKPDVEQSALKTDFIDGIAELLTCFNNIFEKNLLLEGELPLYITLLNDKREEDGLPLVEVVVEMDSDVKEAYNDDENATVLSDDGEASKKTFLDKSIAAMKEKEKIKYAIINALKKFETEGNTYNFTSVYGYIHLLRFIYACNGFLCDSSKDSSFFKKHIRLLNDLLEFLVIRKDDFYHGEADYYPTSKCDV